MNDKKNVENKQVINNISNHDNIETLIVEEEKTVEIEQNVNINQDINIKTELKASNDKYQSATNVNKKTETLTNSDITNVNTRNNVTKPTGRMNSENSNNYGNHINQKSNQRRENLNGQQEFDSNSFTTDSNQKKDNNVENSNEKQHQSNKKEDNVDTNKQKTKENNSNVDNPSKEGHENDNNSDLLKTAKKTSRDVNNNSTSPVNKQDIEKTPGNYLKDRASEGLKKGFNNIKNNITKKSAEKAVAAGAKKVTSESAKNIILSIVTKHPIVLILVGVILMLLLLLLIIAGSGNNVVYGAETIYEEDKHWWPVGSLKTEVIAGKTFAKGEPPYDYEPQDDDLFGMRFHPIYNEYRHHDGIDIRSSSLNIIATMSGDVIGVKSYCVEGVTTGDCGGYGNFVEIEHPDGTNTFYAHLQTDTVTVKVGDKVEQGQVIAQMGSTGGSTGTHLHFEVSINDSLVDPLEYVSYKEGEARPMIMKSLGSFNLLKTSLSKQEFVKLMEAYNYNSDFNKYFKSKAGLIYDESIKNNVNPELVVVTAKTEQQFSTCDGLYNFWGVDIQNGEGCSDGAQYKSMSEGIKGFAKLMNSYNNPDSSEYIQIMAKYKERSKAKCESGGYGTPDTLEGWQSLYSHLGDYWINPGDPGAGGCYYLEHFVSIGYMDGKYNQAYYDKKCPSSTYNCANNDSNCIKTTICEQSDYTRWQVEKKIDVRKEIFKY